MRCRGANHYGLVLVAILSASLAQAANFQVGNCLPKIPTFTTIQGAVSSVPSGSTVLVCPGTYYEQVTISQPLTLRGQSIANLDRPIIRFPPNSGHTVNVTDILGVPIIAQVVVEGVAPAGNVNLIDLTVDGTGGGDDCTTSKALVGIFFAAGTSGSIAGVTARNQVDGGCGAGFWVENGPGPLESITIGNDSVHDMDGAGIVAVSNQNPSTLKATIETSSVTGNNNTQGILSEGNGGPIENNVVTGGGLGIVDVELLPATPGITISNNVVGDVVGGAGIGIVLRESDTVSSNKVSNTLVGLEIQNLSGSTAPVNLTSNAVKNIANTGIEFACNTATLKTNTINDALVAFDRVASGTVLSGASLYNTDTIRSGTCP